MTETEETIKILDKIGKRHYYLDDVTAWWIVSPEGVGSVAVTKRGDEWNYWTGEASKNGFKMLEALAGAFPFIAAKLAEPMEE